MISTADQESTWLSDRFPLFFVTPFAPSDGPFLIDYKDKHRKPRWRMALSQVGPLGLEPRTNKL